MKRLFVITPDMTNEQICELFEIHNIRQTDFVSFYVSSDDRHSIYKKLDNMSIFYETQNLFNTNGRYDIDYVSEIIEYIFRKGQSYDTVLVSNKLNETLISYYPKIISYE